MCAIARQPVASEKAAEFGAFVHIADRQVPISPVCALLSVPRFGPPCCSSVRELRSLRSDYRFFAVVPTWCRHIGGQPRSFRHNSLKKLAEGTVSSERVSDRI